MSTQLVPQEITNYILDFLHDDPKALRACARTCRSWLPQSSRHLFTRVTLASPQSCASFGSLVVSAPDISHLVRDINVAVLPSKISVTEGSDPQAGPLASPFLTTAVTSLTNVNHLTVAMAHFDMYRWDNLVGLQSVVHLTLRCCRFASFVAFTTFIGSFPRLATLDISDTNWPSDEGLVLPPVAPSVETKLTKLCLGAVTSLPRIVEWLVSTTLHRALSSVAVRCSSKNDVVALCALLSAADSVTNLEVYWLLTEDSFKITQALPPPAYLEACAPIKTLSLRVPIHNNRRLTSLTSFLSLVVASAQLEVISLELRLLGEVDDEDWQALRMILSGRNLKRVNVKLPLWPTSNLTGQDLKSYIHKSLPELSARGILRFVRA